MVHSPATHPPQLFDRTLYLRRRAMASAETERLLVGWMAAELADRLALVTRRFEKALLLGLAAESIQDTLMQSGKIAALEVLPPVAHDDLGLVPESYNAIFCLCDLHAVNDVPGQLAQMAGALVPDGLLLVCFFAGETLAELRNVFLAAEVELTQGATPRVAPMIGIRELGGLLQRAGLALPVADLDQVTLRYADAFALMREIKAAGFGNVLSDRSKSFTSRRVVLRAAELYAQQHCDDDGKIRATLEVAWANGWKPHGSQPKPLKPGSGKISLADVLKPGGSST